MTRPTIFLISFLLLNGNSHLRKHEVVGEYEWYVTIWDGSSVGLSLFLEKDSTFNFDYNTRPVGYSTCGEYEVQKKFIILQDFQDPKVLKYIVDCDNKTRTLRDTSGLLPLRRNMWTQFDSTGIIKLQRTKTGLLWIEKNAVLVKK